MKSANAQKKKNDLKIRRHRRVRAKIFGTANCPRFSVFRSAKHITAQLIDDVTGKTLVSAQDGEVEKKKDGGKVAVAKALGALVAERAKTKKIVQSRVTDTQGRYLFIAEPGEYILEVTKPGFAYSVVRACQSAAKKKHS